MQSDKNKPNENNNPKSKINNKMYFIMLIGITFFFVASLYYQYQVKLSLAVRLDEINAQITKAENLHQELLKESEYHDSDEYVEKIARESLGMVKPNEILFIDQNK